MDVHSNSDFEHVVSELSRLDLAESIYETIYYDIQTVLMHQTVPEFWKHFKTSPDDDDNACVGFDKFQIAISWLCNEYSKFQKLLERTVDFKNMCKFKNEPNRIRNDMDYFDLLFRAALLSQIPLNFHKIVDQFYKIVLNVLSNGNTDGGVIEGAVFKCEGCEHACDDCQCMKLFNTYEITYSYLNSMSLFNRIAESSIINLVQEKITNYVKDTCQGSSDISHFERLESWLQSNVFQWSKLFFCNDSDPESEKITHLKEKFNHHLFQTYANTIIDQFFNIIIEYPDSKPSIDDLKICMAKIDLRKYLTATVKKALETRLLHPGVDTGDVLTGYVAAIKALKHLDSSGVLLECITEPVKDYLKKRSDTVRCVITALTEEGPADLTEELAKEETKVTKDDMKNWETWMPDPVDANVKRSSTVRSADIISMVVDIYGSKDLFVNEYRNILADRLLSNLDFNIEKEIRNLELLKLRFGETLLHPCEVMLKDISDSKRINAHIQSDSEYTSAQKFNMSTLIVSSQFWPSFKKKESIEIPKEIQEQFDRFAKSYEAYKGNRTLNWDTINGKVNIEIEFANKNIELAVSTTQATIIMHFQKQSEYYHIMQVLQIRKFQNIYILFQINGLSMLSVKK